MPKFTVTRTRVEYKVCTWVIEAVSRESAQEMAEEANICDGDWETVNAQEYVDVRSAVER